MKKTLFTTAGIVLVIAASALTASAGPITINTGSIVTVDPTATSYGAVRFKDFTNTKDGYRSSQNLYLQNNAGSLGSPTGTDGRARAQSGADDGPLWAVGSNSFSFEYRPIDGVTDLILAAAGNLPSGQPMTTPLSRVINDPAAPVNYISFWIHNTPLNDVVTPDTITLNLFDLDGNALTPPSLVVGAPGGDFNWYLTDPSLLANGFVLTGTINLSTGVDAGEADKIDIAFGHANVSVPDGGVTLALLGGALVGLGVLRRKFNV
jgi:hypothetical protein